MATKISRHDPGSGSIILDPRILIRIRRKYLKYPTGTQPGFLPGEEWRKEEDAGWSVFAAPIPRSDTLENET
jgi:hypothetical protein